MAKQSAGKELLDAISAGTPAPTSEQPTDTIPVSETQPTESVVTQGTETPEAVPPVTPEKPNFLAVMQELGFQDVSDEGTARERLVEAYRAQQDRLTGIERRVGELEPMARYGQEYLQTLRQSQEQQRQPAPVAPESLPLALAPTPKCDLAAVQKYRSIDPATGDPLWAKETPAHVRADYEKYQAFHDQWAHELIYNREEALAPLVRQGVETYLSEIFGGIPVTELPERLDLTGENRRTEQTLTKYQDRLYAKSPITNQIDTDKLTPFGETVRQQLEMLAIKGVPSQSDRLDMAIAFAELKHPVTPAQQTQAARERNKQDVLRRSGAKGIPQRGGGDDSNERPKNKNLSPGQELVAQLAGLGS